MNNQDPLLHDQPVFSLVMATYGRSDELSRFLTNLCSQDFHSFELLVVDQNVDDRLDRILEPFRAKFALIHLHTDISQSKARNIGLSQIKGQIIAFPDDDCWYPDHLLSQVCDLFAHHPEYDGLYTLIADADGKYYPGFQNDPAWVTKLTVWGRVSGPGSFYRRRVIDHIGGFDEDLGSAPHNRFASSEDIDLALRALAGGFRLCYDPTLVVYHPNPFTCGYERLSMRAYSYGMGMGRVWRKHNFPLSYVGYHLSRSLGGALISWLRGNRPRARYQWLSFCGKLVGWRESL